MMEDLVLEGVSVQRGGLPVLQDVSFRLSTGQVLVLRGPNGIGKTTLLRTVAGLQPPLSGTIRGGEDKVAYASHADAIKSTLSVAENLSFWAGIYGTSETAGALAAFDLESLTNRAGGALSAGQKRRLGLARLMVTGRPIWCLDEPTVSLDAASVGRFADAVRAHVAQGGAALIATHIDLGLDAKTLDLGPFKAEDRADGVFDEAFL